MEADDILDWMLAEAKAKPMLIHHDFATRFQVWSEQILPNRLNAIRQTGGDREYGVRMIKLLIEDQDRLRTRALKEGVNGYDKKCQSLCVVFDAALSAYINEMMKTGGEK